MRLSIVGPLGRYGLSKYGLGIVQATFRVSHPHVQQMSLAIMVTVGAKNGNPGPEFGYCIE